MSTEVGRLVGLWRYPVKSMGGESLESVEVSWHGVVGDRRWAFVRAGVERSGFPWLTIRERPDMNAYRPRFVDPTRPDTSAVRVQTPSGAEHDVLDPELASDLGHGARVIKQDRGVFDTFPISLISTQTVAGLSSLVGEDLDVRRFRPNLIVEASGDVAYPEDQWVGSVLQIGSLVLRLDKRDGRCAVVNVDPASGERDSSLLRAIAREREACAGVYGSIVEPGRVTCGDAVMVVR
ncbi:MAG: MOSC N-terminal beta barrel domain-containing protein [Bacteroidota bacterium]